MSDPSRAPRDELFEKVDRLLHDAEHAESGAGMAKAMGDAENAGALDAKAKQLRAEALALDPEKSAPSWAIDEDEQIHTAEANAAFDNFLKRRGINL